MALDVLALVRTDLEVAVRSSARDSEDSVIQPLALSIGIAWIGFPAVQEAQPWPGGAEVQQHGDAPDFVAEYSRWFAEVTELWGRGEAEGARVHFGALLASDLHRALRGAPEEIALAALERMDEIADGIGFLEGKKQVRIEHVRRLSESREEGDRELALARNGLAAALWLVGDYPEARDVFETNLASLEGQEAPDSVLLLNARRGLAFAHLILGDLAAALPLQEAVVKTHEEFLLEGPYELCVARDQLAQTLYQLREFGRARASWETALQGYSELLAEDDPERLSAGVNLALSLRELGEYREAYAVEVGLLDAMHRSPRVEPGLRLQTLADSAISLLGLERHAEAREVLESVLPELVEVLGEEHPSTVLALQNLGVAHQALGELEGARSCFESALEGYLGFLPEHAPQVMVARNNLALACRDLSDFESSRALFQEQAEIYERLDPGGMDLIWTWEQLVLVIKSDADWAEALPLEEAIVAAMKELGVPETDDELLLDRWNLAGTKIHLRDFVGARADLEALLADMRRVREPGDPVLAELQLDLAETLKVSGEFSAARLLEEEALAALEANPSATPASLLGVRVSLAKTLRATNDLAGARALLESTLEAARGTLPRESYDLLGAREVLAMTLSQMGELEDARALQEAVLEARLALPESTERDLTISRANLGILLSSMGQFAAALEYYEGVQETFGRTLDRHDPFFIQATQNLASCLHKLGRFERARRIQESVLEALEESLPDDHLHRIAANQNLAGTLLAEGDLAGARARSLEVAEGFLRRLESVSLLSAREAREVVSTELGQLWVARALIGPFEGQGADSLRFELVETARAAGRSVGATAGLDAELERELAAVRAQLNDLIGFGEGDGPMGGSFLAEVRRLTLERDRLERRAREGLEASELDIRTLRADAVARALPASSAAVGFMRSPVLDLDPKTRRIRRNGDRFDAHVLSPDGSLTSLQLGDAGEIGRLVSEYREALGAPLGGRGVGLSGPVSAGHGTAPDAAAIGRRLRERVFDPVLEAAGDAERLFVCLDDLLLTLPVEALPLDEPGQRLGDRVRVVQEVSFSRLLSSREPSPAEPGVLLVGDVDYDGRGASGSATTHEGNEALRGDATSKFDPLRSTGPEAQAIAADFRLAFDREPVLFEGGAATKAAIHEHAPGKRFLHIATHGWFAPEKIPSAMDAPRSDDQAWAPRSPRETVAGLAPLTLCGLAFAGANRGRDAQGRFPGIMTAEELAGLDLSACELAVLSACKTHVGSSRAGQGIESLQTALHAAGARTAITSLWDVNDAATRKLFERFYRYLWVDGLGKADALWRAKSDLRADGHPVRHWAAWVLSGDPD